MQSTGLTKARSIDHGILWSLPVQHQTQIKNRSSFSYNEALIIAGQSPKKIPEIQQTIEENNIDICALTETCIKVEDDLTQLMICPKGLRAGGGLEVIYKGSIKMKHNTTFNFKMMECVDFTITLPSFSLYLEIIYRPPEGIVLQFSQELADYLIKNITSPDD